jgi:hypothetical protein
MLIPVTEIRQKVAWHGRRVVLAAVAGVLLAIGGGFLLAALWSAVRVEFGPIIASLALAGLFILAALVVLLMRRSRPEPRIPSFEEQVERARAQGKSYPDPDRVPALLDAFLFGMNLYLRLRERRR